MAALCWVSTWALPGTLIHAQQQTPAWQPPSGTLTVPIWPGKPPGRSGAASEQPERNANKPTDELIAGRPILRLGNVSQPTLTLYKAQGTASAPAIVVFPGGGYNILAIDLEGTEVCDRFIKVGIACVLVKYRVPGSGPYPKSEAALDDAQRALGLVRAHALDWGIDPHRVGVLGFSAGAHLAAALSTHSVTRLYPRIDAADEQSCRPDFALIIYPGYLALSEHNMQPNPDVNVTKDVPPTFILQAENDPVHVENAVTYFSELKKAGVPAELHIYAQGGHGYGLRQTQLPITDWPDLAERWLQTIGVLANK